LAIEIAMYAQANPVKIIVMKSATTSSGFIKVTTRTRKIKINANQYQLNVPEKKE